MAPRKSALERTKSPTTQHTIPMKLEFQMVSEFGDFLADGHLGNQFRPL
jgi:hypothetical protein